MRKQVVDYMQGKLPEAAPSTEFREKLSGMELKGDICLYCCSKQR